MGAAVIILHSSVADILGLAGKHHTQILTGLHSLQDIKVERVTLGIQGLDGDYMSHTHMKTDVNVTSFVPLISSLLPHHLDMDIY